MQHRVSRNTKKAFVSIKFVVELKIFVGFHQMTHIGWNL